MNGREGKKEDEREREKCEDKTDRQRQRVEEGNILVYEIKKRRKKNFSSALKQYLILHHDTSGE